MSRLAIVEPKTLMGEAVREAVAAQSDRWDQIGLYTTDSDEVGGVTEIAGRAALVQSLDRDARDSTDVLIFCDREVPIDLPDSLPERCRSVFIDAASPVDRAMPAVAGINSDQTVGQSRISSPAPGVLLLAHLLAPLRDLGELEVTAHVLQPASARGKQGLDELFDQTRSILSMSEERPEEVFGAQLAFNLLPWAGSSALLASELGEILGVDLDARIQLSQAGVFHGCSAGIFLRLAEDPGSADIRSRLLESPMVEQADPPSLLGPVGAATASRILIGELTPSVPRGYWLWSCMDNLTLSAANALSLARP